jgi:membrane fusion protein (multidrug efflux system)
MHTPHPLRFHPHWLPAAAALAVALVLVACSPSQADSGAGASPAPVVGVITVQAQDLALSTELAGRTTPYLIAEVRPQVSGLVQARSFGEGAEVKAGQTLYQIEAARYESALDSAKASLAKAEANLTATRLRAGRYDELAGIEAVSKQARDDAQAALKQAQAEVLAAQAQVRAAQIDLNYTRVSAPISGRIGRSSVTAGALVTANQSETLATIQQLDPIYVDVTQTSAELLRLQKDMAEGRLRANGRANVKLLLEDGSVYPLQGKLQFSEVSVDPGTGSVTLRAVFPNPKRQLLPGMYVRAIVEKGVGQQAILIPQQSVTRDAKGQATALVLGADNTVQARTLQIGQSVGNQWLVTGGLKAGEQVIVDGLQKVQPGAPAQGTPWQPPADVKTAQAPN